MRSKGPVETQSAEEGDHSPLLAELRQWHVFRVAVAFGVVAWLLVQVVATVGPAFDLPEWVLRGVVLTSIIGFLATMGFLLFRPKSAGKGRLPIYLSRRARIAAGIGVLVIATVAAAYAIRSLGAREQVSLAVLPFADLSPARDKAYFAEGVAEEILSTLSTEKGIKVFGRTSARQLERYSDPQEIRASLGVTHLLEGSTRTAGDQLRVNVRLIDTSDGSQLWEEVYHGRLADVFPVQDQIAATVVKRLRGTFVHQTMREAKATTINAYQTYLAARAISRNRSIKTLTEARQLAEKVVAADPAYAPGHALLAELTLLLSDDPVAYGTIPVARARRFGELHARRAIALAPQSAEGYAALGLVLAPKQAIEPLKRAIRLDPSRADIRTWLAFRFDQLGRHDEALEQYLTAAEVEPLWAVPIANLVPALVAAGRQREALQAVRDFVRRGGPEAQAHRFLASAAHWNGDLSSAIKQAHAGLARDPTLPDLRLVMAMDYHIVGLAERAPGGISAQFTRFMMPFYSRDLRELRRRIAGSGARLWDAPDGHFAFFYLASTRDWNWLTRLYEVRRPALDATCEKANAQIIAVALALRHTGRAQEAKAVLQCSRERTSIEARNKARSQTLYAGALEFDLATLNALDGNRTAALRFLDGAVAVGWIGRPYSSRLSDYPQFDSLNSDQRYAALQKRIDASIARERAEILAFK